MKILHVLSDSNIGGAGILLLNCLAHFDRSQFDIKVVLPRDAELCERVKSLGYEVISMKHGKDISYEKEATKELIGIFKAEKPDIVHTHSSFSARIAARKSRVPLIFQTHHCAVMPPKYKTVFPFKQLFGALNNYYSDRIVATAKVASEILQMQGTKKEKISVILNGTEPIRRITSEEKTALRKKLGLSEDDFVFTIAARLEAVKDHKTFIEAASEASRVHPKMRFLVIGKGSLEESLKALAVDLKVDNKLIFTGFCRDIAPYMNITDINVNCSMSETSCLALSEGMSLALPAIASDCDGNCAMVEDGANGLIFERENSEMLATAMITLYENEELRGKMSENAYRIFNEKFTAKVMTEKLQNLYIYEYTKKCKTKG